MALPLPNDFPDSPDPGTYFTDGTFLYEVQKVQDDANAGMSRDVIPTLCYTWLRVAREDEPLRGFGTTSIQLLRPVS